MRSRPIGAGQSILASQADDRRDDSRAGSFLLPHQMLGTLALGTLPSNGQVIPIVINGTTITLTAVSTIGSTPNNILIPGTAAAFAQNVTNFLRRPDLTNSNQVAASGANQSLLQYVGWAWPGSSTNIVPFSLNKNVNGLTGPLTSFNITGITVTSATWTAQTMQLYIEDGTYYIGNTRVLFLGGSTPTFTAPVSNPRIDIITADSSRTIAVVTGTENSSPVAPSYPANKMVICEVYHVVSETAVYDNENQQSGQGYILNDVRPIIGNPFAVGSLDGANFTDLVGIPSGAGIIPLANLPAVFRFGGTGADGALSITSGTTTINCAGASVVVKNYASISITGTGVLAFSNPNVNGTLIILKSQGNVTITSSATPAIDLRSMGGTGGTGGTGSNTSNAGQPGGGGASASAPGAGVGNNSGTGTSTNGTKGGAFIDGWIGPSIGGGQPGVINVSTPASTSPLFTSNTAKYFKPIALPGSGGGGGSNYTGSVAGGNGGAGGGGLYIECAGALNITGIINASGTAGSNAGAYAGAGGGGGAGSIVILYTTLTANSGTYTVTGGSGGTGGNANFNGGAGANGFSAVIQNTEFL